ncbi:hypothetical protein K1719_003560 [Acacia pycnantha]|nr:hypothetical protein K1719_003560 [Acacia pycnantha]
MLKRVVHSLGLVQNHSDKKSRRKKQLSLQYENIFVKIVHEGGQKELYQHAIPASKLMEKYPGMCVALPEVFRDPHQSVLWPEEILMPGHKYIIISCKAVEKLKRKYPEEERTVLETKVAKEEEEDDASEENKGKMDVWQEIFEVNKSVSPSREEAFCSVKEEKNMTHPRKKGIRGKTKPFVPPLPKAKPFRSLVWQPGLSPVQELSV